MVTYTVVTLSGTNEILSCPRLAIIFVALYRGHPNGQITVKFGNGDVYEGNMLVSQFDGKGKLIYAKEKGYYDGQWKLGKPHGKGVRIYADGAKFVGDFRDGVD